MDEGGGSGGNYSGVSPLRVRSVPLLRPSTAPLSLRQGQSLLPCCVNLKFMLKAC